ncbi:hypothetical protein L2E82_14647 [Cichorium intybus]|uniref:Uncharacterized protein n=1 Tax=Cichorium intybus TaxID=13427 RepID=A0ACB9F1R2_CICIN|nr:hypothetical protein L2E82_14647 [Cichorium intybus]
MERRARVAPRESEWQEVRQRNSKEYRYPVIEKATTIFISDFPSDWVEADLWSLLKSYGTLVDIYIAMKRTKTNTRFGFARFIRVTNTQEPVGRLNDIPCGNSRLRANLAKYKRKKVPPPPSFADNRNDRVSMETNQRFGERRTFADVVNNRSLPKNAPPKPHPHIPPRPPQSSTYATKEIRFLSSALSRNVAKSTLIGESESFEKLMNIKAFKEVEGIPNVELRYVGGLNTLIEFEDEADMHALLVNGEHIWKP